MSNRNPLTLLRDEALGWLKVMGAEDRETPFTDNEERILAILAGQTVILNVLIEKFGEDVDFETLDF